MFVLGLDVGLSDLYSHLLDIPTQGAPVALGDVCVVPNSSADHQELCVWLQTYSAGTALTAVVIESASVYWERIAVCLHDAGFAVSVVNAVQIKYFAKSLMRRGKTGKMDAELIARYGDDRHSDCPHTGRSPPYHRPPARRRPSAQEQPDMMYSKR